MISAQKRKIAILVMVVVAALITPTTDPFSLAMLSVPMILLYELGFILMVRKNIAPEGHLGRLGASPADEPPAWCRDARGGGAR